MKKLTVLSFLFFLSTFLTTLSFGQVASTFSCNNKTGNALTAVNQFCINSNGSYVLPAGVDTHNIYIIPEGTPGTITVIIQGSVKGDFTDAVTCGTSSTTTPNLLSCTGIYANVRAKLTVFTGFTSVNITYVGTSSVAKNGGGVLTGAGAPSGSCTAAQLYVDTSTGNLYSCNGGTWILVSGGGGNTTSSVLVANNFVMGSAAHSIADSTISATSFNGVSQLVKLDGSGFLPALNGSALTALNGSNIATGTVAAARVATLNQNTTGAAWTGTYTPAANKVLGGASPAAVTITSTYVDTSICSNAACGQNTTGTAADLSTTLSVAHGGSGTGATLTGFLRGSGSAFTGTELSGDCTTSGSGVLTCPQLNGTNFTVNTSGLVTKDDGLTTAGKGHGVEIINSSQTGISMIAGTGQIGSTVTITVPSTGWYQITPEIVETTAGSGGTCAAGTINVQVAYTQGQSGVVYAATNIPVWAIGSVSTAGITAGMVMTNAAPSSNVDWISARPLVVYSSSNILLTLNEQVGSNCTTPPVFAFLYHVETF